MEPPLRPAALASRFAAGKSPQPLSGHLPSPAGEAELVLVTDDDLARKAIIEHGEMTPHAGVHAIGRPLEMAALLVKAGFSVVCDYNAPLKPGDILVDSICGSDYLYVTGQHAETIQHLVDFLQGSDLAGVILTRRTLPGDLTDAAQAGERVSERKPNLPVDGRMLREALVNEEIEEARTPCEGPREAVREIDNVRWRQFLQVTRCGHAVYFTER